MSQTVHVKTESKSYRVLIEEGLRFKLGETLKEILTPAPSSVFIISDSNVAPLYLQDVVNSFNDELPVFTETIPSGEASKSFAMYEQLLTKALASGLDRKAVVIALGGGVVGDLAGFVAATFMRGIRFVQVPTTLLAHDSSVGGKVAINHPLGKNMVGSFHQPESVIYDIETLYTMPVTEWRSGFAEVIKHGFIRDQQFLTKLEEEIKTFDSIPREKLANFLQQSITVKAMIVSEDERENGVRAHLNLGHTLGHAIETELGYGVLTHGEAVAIGIIFALRISEKMYGIDLKTERYEKWFQSLGYQTRIPKKLSGKQLLKTMTKDKKAESGIIRMVLLEQLGQATVQEVDETLIEQMLTERMEGNSIG